MLAMFIQQVYVHQIYLTFSIQYFKVFCFFSLSSNFCSPSKDILSNLGFAVMFTQYFCMSSSFLKAILAREDNIKLCPMFVFFYYLPSSPLKATLAREDKYNVSRLCSILSKATHNCILASPHLLPVVGNSLARIG